MLNIRRVFQLVSSFRFLLEFHRGFWLNYTQELRGILRYMLKISKKAEIKPAGQFGG